MVETLYRQSSLGKRLTKKAKEAGGWRKAAAECDVPYSVLFAMARGREPRTEYFLRVVKWLNGETLRY